MCEIDNYMLVMNKTGEHSLPHYGGIRHYRDKNMGNSDINQRVGLKIIYCITFIKHNNK